MTLKLQDYIDQLKLSPPVPSFEPVIDDLDEKQDRKLRYSAAELLLATETSVSTTGYCLCGDHWRQHYQIAFRKVALTRLRQGAYFSWPIRRELEDLSSGAVQTGQLEPGDGGASPSEGFLVSCIFL